MSDFARGTRGNSFIIEWCQITLRGGRRIKHIHSAHYMRTMYANAVHVIKNVQFSSVINTAQCAMPISCTFDSCQRCQIHPLAFCKNHFAWVETLFGSYRTG